MAARLWPVDAVAGAPSYTGRALRQTLAPLLPGATAARPLGAQSGVRPGTPSTTVSVAGSTWTVGPHAGILDLETALQAGPYAYAFDANVTGAVNAAHATYTRWDGIYVQLSDPAESDGSSVPGVAVVYVAGTAAASPAMPTQPARSLLLARIVVPKSGSGSASVVWLAPAVMQGVPVFASWADLQARNPAGADGQRAYTLDYGVSWRWSGTAWVVDGVPALASTAARDAAIPSPTAGVRVVIGSGAAMVEQIHDGTAWKSAVVDSGWVAITLSGGWTSVGDAPAYRVYRGVVEIKGGALLAAGTAGTAYTLGTLAAPALPSSIWETITWLPQDIDNWPVQTMYAYIDEGGTIKVRPSVTGRIQTPLKGLGGYIAKL